ncbi:MAG: VWA domain-containing protein [Deltaproteobacteria bacterium]|nr:VWA domain-containing protein [Deltaproteobacteria bacterium]
MSALCDPETALEQLTSARAPWLFGVRHHSPACAAALPALLDALRPRVVFVELPVELQPLLVHLGHPDALAPLAATVDRGTAAEGDVVFYPLADFSPELVAIRWAARNNVPVEAFDLPVTRRRSDAAAEAGRMAPASAEGEPEADAADGGPSAEPGGPPELLAKVRAGLGLEGADLWERLVEQHAESTQPEALRRAALAYGWAVRAEGGADAELLQREAHMRARLQARGAEGAAAIVGSAHAAGLLLSDGQGVDPLPRLADDAPAPLPAPVALIPYSYGRFDPSSGYPAGIADPAWQQRRLEALAADQDPDGGRAAAALAVDICRRLRALGHVASLPDARETARVAVDLAALRDLRRAGRRELREALTLTLAQGEEQGRGRVLARCVDLALIGERRGRLPPGVPRGGLEVEVEGLIEALKLPGPGAPAKVLELDPLRSELDRRRHVALLRLHHLGVHYATRDDEVLDDDGLPRLTARWTAEWTDTTAATVALHAARGPRLTQALSERLREERAQLELDDRVDARALLGQLQVAADCGLHGHVEIALHELELRGLPVAGLEELVEAIDLVERLRRHQVPALPPPGEGSAARLHGAVGPWRSPRLHPAADDPRPPLPELLLHAAIRCLDGVAGSEEPRDARALGALCRGVAARAAADAGADDDLSVGHLAVPDRLLFALRELAERASPLMRGAAAGASLVLEDLSPEAVASTLRGLGLAAGAPEANDRLSGWLVGLVSAAEVIFEAHEPVLAAARDLVEGEPDPQFLRLLLPLRVGFGGLSAPARERLLRQLAPALGGWAGPRSALGLLEHSPETLLAMARAELAAQGALTALGLPAPLAWSEDATAAPERAPAPVGGIPPIERWRMVLAQQRRRLSPMARRLMRGIDGALPRGEGNGGDLGGDEPSFPTAREWGEELNALFGERVREEVLGRAAAAGLPAAALELDPEQVRPSVELLAAVLQLRGGMPEADRARLRALARRITEQLVEALAVRAQPALSGLLSPRRTRHRTDRVDLPGVIRSNLHTARQAEDGTWRLAPERVLYRRRSRRSMDWRVILVVDTSGSMEASVIYAAMMAAIIGGLPAVEVNFLAFSTEVIDLSAHCDDPLALLLEVHVGGGTDIGKALAYARRLVRTPSRTLVVVVSDFEEGGRPGRLVHEVRSLTGAGVTCLGLAALDDRAVPRYSVPIAEMVKEAGMPVAALSPLELARWVAEQLR